MSESVTRLRLEVQPQPDDWTCGPTCLHALYRFYGHDVPLARVVAEIPALETGGTQAVALACHALGRGFDATIYTYNLQLFDPTWFAPGVDIPERLRAQVAAKVDRKLEEATRIYLDFFERGGRVRFEELDPALIRRYLKRGNPILTGLSATYLYGSAREHDDASDDIRGTPAGHFVVLSGYDPERRAVMVADPLQDNPGFRSHYYDVGVDRLIGAIFLGIITYDANLLVITPKGKKTWPH